MHSTPLCGLHGTGNRPQNYQAVYTTMVGNRHGQNTFKKCHMWAFPCGAMSLLYCGAHPFQTTVTGTGDVRVRQGAGITLLCALSLGFQASPARQLRRQAAARPQPPSETLTSCGGTTKSSLCTFTSPSKWVLSKFEFSLSTFTFRPPSCFGSERPCPTVLRRNNRR